MQGTDTKITAESLTGIHESDKIRYGSEEVTGLLNFVERQKQFILFTGGRYELIS